MIDGVTGVVIAGGKSRRMGQDKRFLQVGGISLLDRAVNVLEAMFSAVIVSMAEPVEHWNARGHRLVYDEVPGCGSLGGLYSALRAAPHAWIFAVACDMPLLDPRLVHHMAQSQFMAGADIVAVRLKSGFQPMHAFYSKRCLPSLEHMVRERRLKIQDVFGDADVRATILPESDVITVDPQLLSFRNVNTPEDLATVVATLGNSSTS